VLSKIIVPLLEQLIIRRMPNAKNGGVEDAKIVSVDVDIICCQHCENV
jgi:hypothetical protein